MSNERYTSLLGVRNVKITIPALLLILQKSKMFNGSVYVFILRILFLTSSDAIQ